MVFISSAHNNAGALPFDGPLRTDSSVQVRHLERRYDKKVTFLNTDIFSDIGLHIKIGQMSSGAA
jgi:hypothetical protein